MPPRNPLLLILPLLALAACAPTHRGPSGDHNAALRLQQRPLVFLETIGNVVSLSPVSNLATNRTTVTLKSNEAALADLGSVYSLIELHSIECDGENVTLIEQAGRTTSFQSIANQPSTAAHTIASTNRRPTSALFTTSNAPGATAPETVRVIGVLVYAVPESQITDHYRFDGDTLAYQVTDNLVVRCDRDTERNSQTFSVEYDSTDFSLANIPLDIDYIDANEVRLPNITIPPTNSSSGVVWRYATKIDTDNQRDRTPPAGVRITRATRLIWTEVPFAITFNALGDTPQQITTLPVRVSK